MKTFSLLILTTACLVFGVRIVHAQTTTNTNQNTTCGLQISQQRDTAVQQIIASYNQQWQLLFQQRSHVIAQAWTLTDTTMQRNAMSDANNDFRRKVQQLRADVRDALQNLDTAYRSAQQQHCGIRNGFDLNMSASSLITF